MLHAYEEYSYLIRAIAKSEPVLVVAQPGDIELINERLADTPHLLLHPLRLMTVG